MCGIAVIVCPDPSRARAGLEAMVAAQTHRGPDDLGFEYVTHAGVTLGLGQRRLAIIDLSPLGHQPMRHEPTGDLLTYNGELYNYLDIRKDLEALGVRFTGHSDTEVMLAALVQWGPAALRRFRGMFAVAWYRAASNTLVLARDPLGIKPMYLARAGGALLVASEVRGILASGIVERRINRRAVASLLAFGAVQDPDSIVEGVTCFPAGAWQEIPLHAAHLANLPKPAYFWRHPAVDSECTETDAVERVRRTLDLAVRDHLISDVPVGIFLSSGLDSTIIAALAARHTRAVSTYTVGFADNPDLSETEPAARTAHALGLKHVDVQIATTQALHAVENWLDSLDQPSIDGLNTYVVTGAVKNAGITVALSGLGGDELFCGYSSFADAPRLQTLMHRTAAFPVWVRTLLARAASIGQSRAYREKLVEIARTGSRLTDLYFQRRRAMSARQLDDLGIAPRPLGLSRAFVPPEALADIDLLDHDPVVAISRLETRFYTGNMLLRDSDAMGMAHSLEIRVPFFDTGVLNECMAIPGNVRMPSGIANKHLLRQAFADLIPGEVLGISKRGFALPIRRWMNTSLRARCEQSLADLKRADILESDGIDRIWRDYLDAPESAIWSRAFALCVLGDYVTRVIHRAPSASASTPTAAPPRPRTKSWA
jgi:asparagine synthase (glutamine-hydrolysing)